MQPALPQSRCDLEFDFGGFHNLMPNRVHHILLVSSLYESFILEEDGLISEMITSEFVDMKLSHAPRVAHVSTGEQALSFIRQNPVDLVITMTRLGNLNVAELAKSIKEISPDLPVVVLADNARELVRNPGLRDRSCIDRVFVWHGDAKILLTIVKLVEDQMNVEHDT
ncbi:MAG: hypothetical protein IID34_02565, partial [Planctomycetes bacterium]|nr:hypothetical protein [Planctomycetota bacterium]